MSPHLAAADSALLTVSRELAANPELLSREGYAALLTLHDAIGWMIRKSAVSAGTNLVAADTGTTEGRLARTTALFDSVYRVVQERVMAEGSSFLREERMIAGATHLMIDLYRRYAHIDDGKFTSKEMKIAKRVLEGTDRGNISWDSDILRLARLIEHIVSGKPHKGYQFTPAAHALFSEPGEAMPSVNQVTRPSRNTSVDQDRIDEAVGQLEGFGCEVSFPDRAAFELADVVTGK